MTKFEDFPDSTKIIGTHSGTFHSDDVAACYLLRKTKTFKNSKIIRSRDPEVWKTTDILVDVGAQYDPQNMKFDHHQNHFTETFSPNHSIPLSGAGLVYKHFGKEVICNILDIEETNPFLEILFQRLYTNFIESIDGVDNGVCQYENVAPKYKIYTDLSTRIANLNPSWNDTNPDIIGRFEEGIKMVGKELEETINNLYKSWLPARKIVEDSFISRFNVHSSGLIILLSQFCPWQSHLFDIEQERLGPNEPKPLYIVFQENGNPTWRVRCIPTSGDSFESRLVFPTEWRAKDHHLLNTFTNTHGCVFVHPGGFIAGNQTKEGAISMALASIHFNRDSNK